MTAGTPALPRVTGSRVSGAERWRELRIVSRGDVVYQTLLTALALVLPLLLAIILGELIVGALPAIRQFGFGFLTHSVWDPVNGQFGALPLITGTLYSALVALVIAVPLALGAAIFLTEFAPRWMRTPVGTLIELLAGVPSVIYGLWGMYVLIPLQRDVIWPVVRPVLSHLPFFSGVFYGPSMLAGGTILAIMCLPYMLLIEADITPVIFFVDRFPFFPTPFQFRIGYFQLQ